MKFVGYTYKADVEEQRSMLVKVLKDLGNMEQYILALEDGRIKSYKGTNSDLVTPIGIAKLACKISTNLNAPNDSTTLTLDKQSYEELGF